jgi:hypothetical protein
VTAILDRPDLGAWLGVGATSIPASSKSPRKRRSRVYVYQRGGRCSDYETITDRRGGADIGVRVCRVRRDGPCRPPARWVDMAAYCHRHLSSFATAGVYNLHSAYSWNCWGPPLQGAQTVGINVNLVCSEQYGLGAYSRPLDPGNPYSWRCFQMRRVIAGIVTAAIVATGCGKTTQTTHTHSSIPTASTTTTPDTSYEQYTQYLINNGGSAYMQPRPTLHDWVLYSPQFDWRGPVAQAVPSGGPGIPVGSSSGVWGRYNDGNDHYILDDIIQMWPDASAAKQGVEQARRDVHLTADAKTPKGSSNTPQSVDVGDGGFLAMGTSWPGPATIHGLEGTVHSNWLTVLTFSVGRFTVAMEFWSVPSEQYSATPANPAGVIATGKDQATYLPG